MKLKYFFLFITLLVGYNANAQLYFGVKASGNLTMDFFQSTQYQLLNYTVSPGLIVKFTKEPKWGMLQLDVNYVNKDFQLKKSATEYDIISANVIHANFLSHIQMGKKNFKFGFNVGPYGSYMLDANRQYAGADTAYTLSVTSSENYSPRIDYGITGGLTTVYQFFFGDIQLDANFSLSYSSLTASLEQQAFDFRNNQLIQLGVSYLFCPSRLKEQWSKKGKKPTEK